MSILRVLEFTKDLISKHLNQGDIAIDATCGNGNDTVFLAKLVGENGKVFGFDIQEEAIKNTLAVLSKEGLNNRVECLKVSHSIMDQYVKENVKVVMFNLGYLPGSDKQITTKGLSTIKAIEAALSILATKGLITMVVYQGHDDGEEAQIVEDYLRNLPQKEFSVLRYQFVNQVHYPPYLIAIEKKDNS